MSNEYLQSNYLHKIIRNNGVNSISHLSVLRAEKANGCSNFPLSKAVWPISHTPNHLAVQMRFLVDDEGFLIEDNKTAKFELEQELNTKRQRN